MKTEICELLGIEYPLFQGGMAWVADASLASAVSNAGGLGIVAAMSMNGEQLRAEIRKTRERTERPFGVNVMLMSPFAEEVAKVVVEEHVPVVTTGAGNPSKFMPEWIENGVKVVPVVPSTALAKLAERRGASAVVAEGGESGGHIGELTTMALVPQVADTVKIPVLAAGGIGDGRGVAAAFMLGAVGVQMGTRFLVAKECTIHQNYKDRVLSAKDIDTIATGRRLGHPVRSLKSTFSRMFAEKEFDPSVTSEELESLGGGALRLAAREGDGEHGCFMAGQIAGLVKSEQTCREIIEEVMREADILLAGASKWVR